MRCRLTATRPTFGSALTVLVITALLAAVPVTAGAAVRSETVVSDMAVQGAALSVSSSLVAVPLVGSGILVWDRALETSRVIETSPVGTIATADDLVAWREATAENPFLAARLQCFNARTGETTLVAEAETRNIATDGRYVVYDLVPAGGTRCWDSLTGTTRVVPTTNRLWRPSMREGLLVWIDDLVSIAEGSDPDMGRIRAWNAATGRLTQVTALRRAVRDPKTDGRIVAWWQDGVVVWDPAIGEPRRVPGMSGDFVLDHGVVVGLHADSYAVRYPSGSVRTVTGDSPFPDQADYSDGLLSGVFYDDELVPGLRAVDVHTGVSDVLASQVTTRSSVRAAGDMVASTTGTAGTLSVSRLARPVRVEGRDRYDVAVDAAEATYPRWQGVRHVVIASGEDRASSDPLAAAGLCWRYDAPLLLVSSADAPASVRAAVREIVHNNGPVTIHVVGGTVSVPDRVISQIRQAAGVEDVTVDRIAGSNRYVLAAAIAGRVASGHEGPLPAALVANGADPSKFFDAAALSAISAAQGYPVLLVARDRVPLATSSFLTSAAPEEVIAAGGAATISATVLNTLGAQRWAGSDRYATASAIAAEATDPDRGWLSADTVGIATLLPDALSGGVLTGHRGGPLLLGARSALPSPTAAWLSANTGEIGSVWVLGGSDSLASSVLSQASVRAFD